MTISPMSYLNHQKTYNIKSNNHLKNKSDYSKNSAVSFKGLEKVVSSKATSETVKKNGGKILAALAALLGFVGIKTATTNSVNPAKIAKKHSVTDIEQQLADIEEKITLTQDVDELSNLTTQRNAYRKALAIKGLEMMEADNIRIEYHLEDYSDYLCPVPAHYELFKKGAHKQKASTRDLEGVARTYAKFKNSGLDFVTFFSQNPENRDIIAHIISYYDSAAEKLIEEAITPRYNELAAKYPDLIAAFDRAHHPYQSFANYEIFPIDKRLKILEAYDADPTVKFSTLDRWLR